MSQKHLAARDSTGHRQRGCVVFKEINIIARQLAAAEVESDIHLPRGIAALSVICITEREILPAEGHILQERQRDVRRGSVGSHRRRLQRLNGRGIFPLARTFIIYMRVAARRDRCHRHAASVGSSLAPRAAHGGTVAMARQREHLGGIARLSRQRLDEGISDMRTVARRDQQRLAAQRNGLDIVVNDSHLEGSSRRSGDIPGETDDGIYAIGEIIEHDVASIRRVERGEAGYVESSRVIDGGRPAALDARVAAHGQRAGVADSR